MNSWFNSESLKIGNEDGAECRSQVKESTVNAACYVCDLNEAGLADKLGCSQ